MKRYFLFLLIAVFIISFTSAGGLTKICIDKTPPSAPSNLEVTISGDDVTLTWEASTDIPECSGVDYYVVLKDGNNIGTSYLLSFQDINVNPGNYSYSVYAVDKIRHNSGPAIKNDVIIEEVEGKKKVRGGGGSSSYICEPNWECTEWSECSNELRTRNCHNTNNCAYSYNKPIERTDCETTFNLEGISLTKPSEEGFFSIMTGAAIGGVTNFAKSGLGAFVFVILIVGATGMISFRLYRLRKRLK